VLTNINILFDADEGVIVTDKVFEAVTNDNDVVLLLVESVALKTWITCPALAETPAKLKTPLPFVWRTCPEVPSAITYYNVIVLLLTTNT